MNPIPKKIRERLSKDPFMEKCIACGKTPVEWNHAIIYAGKQSNNWYAIVPLCTSCHRGNNGDIMPYAKYLSELIAIKRGMSEIYKDMPRIDWFRRKQYLEDKLKKFV